MRRRAAWVALLAVAGAAAWGFVTWADGPAAEGTATARRMPLDAFKTGLDRGSLVAIDVRSAEAYAGGHIPGSLSRPLSTLQTWAPAFKGQGKTIVAYCA